MHYANEMRPVENVPNLSSTISVDSNQLKLALQIVKGMTGTSDLKSYSNPEQERLLAAIQSKIAGQNIVLKPTQESEVVVDLLEALRESVRMNKGKNKVAAPKESKRGTPNEKLG